MLDDGELQALARAVAALDDEDVGRLKEAVRTRKAEAHLAELRAMSDEDVMLLMFSRHHDNWPNPNALRLLREAGFVRGKGLKALYRAGWNEALNPCPNDGDAEYKQVRDNAIEHVLMLERC